MPDLTKEDTRHLYSRYKYARQSLQLQQTPTGMVKITNVGLIEVNLPLGTTSVCNTPDRFCVPLAVEEKTW